MRKFSHFSKFFLKKKQLSENDEQSKIKVINIFFKRYTVLFTFDFLNDTIQNLMKIREGGQKFVHSPLFAVIVRILFSSVISVKHAT